MLNDDKLIDTNPVIKDIIFKANRNFPNNSLPLIIYKHVLLVGKQKNKAAKAFQKVFLKNNWKNTWTNGIYSFHHYHSNTHECIGIASGKASVIFGGTGGRSLSIEKGDVVIIPAGLAHKCSKSSKDFLCVGAYPGGNEYDINLGTKEELEKAMPRIAKLPKPALDPVFGKEGFEGLFGNKIKTKSMPELPDVEVFARNLDKLFAGKKLLKVKIINGKKLKDKPAEFSKSLSNKTLKRIYRSGKEMRFEFSRGTLLGLHLMLTGDIYVFDKKNERRSAIAELYFSGGQGLVLTDRMGNANIRLNPVDKKGVDAISPALNYKYLKQALQRRTTIKKLLTDQDVIRGIGNSYSDEILWEARISPYSVAMAIPDEKIRELVVIIKKILKKEIRNIYNKYKGKINVEVKEFLKIHTKERTKSPTGAPIIIDKKGMMKTYYTKEQKLYKLS